MYAPIVNCALGSLFVPVFILIMTACIVSATRRLGRDLAAGKILCLCFLISWLVATLKCVLLGREFDETILLVLSSLVWIAILFWIASFVVNNIRAKRAKAVLHSIQGRELDMADSGMVSHKDEEAEPKSTTLNIESEALKRAKASTPDGKTLGIGVGNDQIPGKESEATEECRTFPFSEELERRVYSYLLQQEIDRVTMLRAKVKAEGDKDKTEVFYYKMKYQELLESGEIERFKEELLAEAHEKEIREIAKSLSLDQPLTVSACGQVLSILGYALVEEELGKRWAVNLPTGGTSYYYTFKNLEDFTRSMAAKTLAALPDNSSGSTIWKERFREALLGEKAKKDIPLSAKPVPISKE